MAGTDRVNTPLAAPKLYRKATIADILNVGVDGFYEADGTYWRKNGGVKTWKRRPRICTANCAHTDGHARVPVKYGIYSYGYVDHDNIHMLFVRIDEVRTFIGGTR